MSFVLTSFSLLTTASGRTWGGFVPSHRGNHLDYYLHHCHIHIPPSPLARWTPVFQDSRLEVTETMEESTMTTTTATHQIPTAA